MKFLCLPGAYGSAATFEIQLQPLVRTITEQSDLRFAYTQGKAEATPPPQFERSGFFGPPPYYRFVYTPGMYEWLRGDLPAGEEHEDTMRGLQGQIRCPWADIERAMDALLETIEANPDIQGILGYSEGTTIGSTLLLEEARREALEGRPRRIKYAIFIAGWPPMCEENGRTSMALADETDVRIEIPTLHIVGCDDPYLAGSMALYNMCDEDTAELLDHGRGHTVPRDADSIRLVCEAVKRLVAKA
ncbi:hypothetical protein N658DRAFT_510930 [Parathielavia hyrcaniae]|uniref:Serine hydrolase domain-containing protein n=1 Tax=Parathielavia hyrcaniae TaxID=113614 RepID=A0AAN6PTJ2_9PEZI|nr:hypothetical protein N658DRAFT_510930 [Parathielavia hyrcaniae]